jgi:ferritin-like metal-binding protein YciE
MTDARNLHDAFVDELRDAYDAERQITKALPQLITAATSPELRSAFESHLEETHRQVGRLEEVFDLLGEPAKGKRCEGVAGILEEGRALLAGDFDDATMDACLIASAQRVEHYEMAAYGTLVAWAEAMGHEDVIGLFRQSLEEEKGADRALSALAEAGINLRASDLAMDGGSIAQDDEDDDREVAQTRAQSVTAGRKPSSRT